MMFHVKHEPNQWVKNSCRKNMQMNPEISFPEAVARLAAAGIEAPAREARLLLAHALGRAPESLIGERPPPPAGFAALIARRAAREPLAFILGRREFWSLSFAVSPTTLIPRPESETLLEFGSRRLPRPARSAARPRPRHRHRLPAARRADRIPLSLRGGDRPRGGGGAARARERRRPRPRRPRRLPGGRLGRRHRRQVRSRYL